MSLIPAEVITMAGHLISFRRDLVVVAIFTLVPGLSAFLLARHHTNSEIQTFGSVDIDGLRIHQAVIDIGKVWSGGVSVQREFTLENRTGHQIKIESVESDCGCTVANVVTSEVPDGKSTKIPVVFWPPVVANDRGGEFRRTITVAVETINGRKSISLALTGFVEPDASLRVFPVNVDLETPTAKTRSTAILHFKGSAGLLASIPDTLLVSPGRTERVVVQTPPAGHVEAIGTKDVEIKLRPNASFKGIGDWISPVTFAPDQSSDGLTIHVRGHGPQSIVASPPSVMLTDDSTSQDATVLFTSKTGIALLPESVQTGLPLACDFLPESSVGSTVRILRIRVKQPMSEDATGNIQVRLNPPNAPSEMITIPVVILHSGPRGHS
jgi:hypothetical protein